MNAYQAFTLSINTGLIAVSNDNTPTMSAIEAEIDKLEIILDSMMQDVHNVLTILDQLNDLMVKLYGVGHD